MIKSSPVNKSPDKGTLSPGALPFNAVFRQIRRTSWLALSRWSLLAIFGLLAVLLAGCTGRDIIGTADGWTPVAESDGMVYAATRSGDVLALDSQALDRDEDAGHIWKYSPNEDNELGSVFGTPALGENFLYVGSSYGDGDRGKLVALRRDRESSSRIEQNEWEEVITGAIVGGPVLADDKVLVGSEDGMLYSFDAETGDRLWTFSTQGLKMGLGKERRIWSTPTVDNGVVYFGAMDGYLYAISLNDGAELWKFKTNGAVITTPLVVGSAIIFGSFDRILYALDASNMGAILWTFKSDSWFWAGPVSDGETVYAANMSGEIFALPLNRQGADAPIWVHEIGDTVNSTPVLTGDKLVVAAKNGIVSLLDTTTGTAEEIPLLLEKDIRAPLAAAGNDESARVYFGDKDGVVRSLDVDRWRISWTLSTQE